LAYINAAYVQPILEAVDDDGTGFVSVKEVNTFVESRPEGWSLPTWIAFWAVGWQASISKYKNQIYGVVQTMFQVLEHVLPSNRRAIDEYLFHASFWRIELLLRSTRSIGWKVMADPDLARITEVYSGKEEERIEVNLKDVGYELDTPATVALVTGEGRIERVSGKIALFGMKLMGCGLQYIFPLLYLLLKRHLKVMKLACQHVLDAEELACLNESLVSVLLTVDERIQNLEGMDFHGPPKVLAYRFAQPSSSKPTSTSKGVSVISRLAWCVSFLQRMNGSHKFLVSFNFRTETSDVFPVRTL
jgi:hypothetical protein